MELVKIIKIGVIKTGKNVHELVNFVREGFKIVRKGFKIVRKGF